MSYSRGPASCWGLPPIIMSAHPGFVMSEIRRIRDSTRCTRSSGSPMHVGREWAQSSARIPPGENDDYIGV